MASLIDPTKPTSINAYSQDVRDNFATAASEIGALQDAVGAAAATGSTSIGSGTTQIKDTVGTGVPGGATVGFDRAGSRYTDVAGQPGAMLYISGGDGTWAPVG